MSCCLFALAFVRSCLVCLTCDVWIKRIHQIGTNLAAKTKQPTALCRPRLYSWHFDGVCKRRCRKRFSSLSNPWSLFFSDFSSFWMSKWSCVCVWSGEPQSEMGSNYLWYFPLLNCRLETQAFHRKMFICFEAVSAEKPCVCGVMPQSVKSSLRTAEE